MLMLSFSSPVLGIYVFLLIVGVLVPVGMLGLGEFTGPRVHNNY